MFDLIRKVESERHITEKDIEEIEGKYKIHFPRMLKEYYLNYNGDRIYLRLINTGVKEYGVAEIVALKYADEGCDFESIVDMDRKDNIIDKHFYPLACDEGGDYFYWDDRNENVFMIYCDDIENPKFVCDSIQRFFEMMEGK